MHIHEGVCEARCSECIGRVTEPRKLYIRQGRIRGGTYFVQEIAGSPHPDLPHRVEPDTAEPCTVNPEALITTDVNLKRTTTTTPINTKGCSGT